MKLKLPILAAATMLGLQSSAFAAPFIATADLAMRSGPDTTYPVVGVIERNAVVEVMGCIDAGNWCNVAWAGKTGWSFAGYLAYRQSGVLVPLHQARAQLQIPSVVYSQQAAVVPVPQIATVGTAPPFNPARATFEALNPPTFVQTYVMTHRVDPVYLEGDIRIGATLPPTVALYRVPDYQYYYTYVNNRAVLVEPGTNRVIYVYPQQAAAVPMPQVASVGTVPPFNPQQATFEALNPPQFVQTYVMTHRVDPVHLNGDIIVGATLPPTVSLYRVPDYQYYYTYVNNRVVLVEPGTNRIVYVYS